MVKKRIINLRKKVSKKVSRRNHVEKMWNLDKNETLEGGNYAE